MKILAKTYTGFLAVVVCALMAGCGGGGKKANNLVLSLASGTVTAGQTSQLRATRANSDGTPVDVTTSVTWSSSVPSVATVNQQGLLTALISGTTSVTASQDTASGTLAVGVGLPALTSLALTPPNTSVPVGYTQQFSAEATYANSSQADVTGSVQWSVTPASIATIDQSGLLTAKGTGAFTVTATSASITASITGAATAAVLSSVAITPPNPSIAEGSTQQFTTSATFSDGSVRDVSSGATWSSSNTGLLQISGTGLATALTNVPTGMVTIFAQVSGTIASTQVNVTPQSVAAPDITALVVTPTSSSVAKNTGQQLTAIGYLADGSQIDVSSMVTWSSNNPSVSSVDATGLMTTGNPGASTIQATIATPATASRRLRGAADTTLQAQSVSLVTTATLVQLIAQSSVPSLPVGTAQQLQAFGIFSDGTKQDLTALVTWQANNAAVASVSATGLASGLAAGAATFTATFGGQSDATPTLQVTSASLSYLTLSIGSVVFISGNPQNITVIGNFSDNSVQDLTSQSTFTSSNPTSVIVNPAGTVVGVSPGEATITASALGQSTTVVVDNLSSTLVSLSVQPSSTNMALGTTQQAAASAVFSDSAVIDLSKNVVWGSTNPAVFTVDTAGIVHANSVGTAQVTASALGVTGVSANLNVTNATLTALVVSPAAVRLASGTNQQFVAVGTFSDGTTQDVSPEANWSVADEKVAQSTNAGGAVALAPGSTVETATLMGQTASTTLFVVANSTLVSVAITPVNPVIAFPLVEQLHLIGTFDDGSTQDLTQCALWSSSNPAVAGSTLPGLVITSGVGQSLITAQCGAASAFTNVSVAEKTIAFGSIVPSQAEVSVGGAQSFSLLVTFTDGSSQTLDTNIAWASSSPTIGTMAGPVHGEDLGHAIGVSPGVTTITATALGGPQRAPLTATLYVTPKPLGSVQVTPINPTLASGVTQQFVAQATYSDQTSGDISKEVAWTSSNPSLVSIDANGLATTHSSPSGGAATITATTGTFVASSVVTEPADAANVLTSVQVVPTSSRIAAGTPQQLTARGTYTDGTTRDVSSNVTWTSSDPSTATVSATGLVTGVAPGTATMLAQSGTLQSPSAVIVTAATLVSVAVSPSGATFANGTTEQFQLIGAFSDGSTQVLTGGVAWQSTNPASRAFRVPDWPQEWGPAPYRSPVLSMDRLQPPPRYRSAQQRWFLSLCNQIPLALPKARASSSVSSDPSLTEPLKISPGMAVFQSSDPTVAYVSQTGLGTGVGLGSAQITVSAGGMSVTSGSVQISPPTLLSISITPASPHFAAGTNQAFTAIGTFSDGSTEDITNQVVWTSATPSVATINQYGVAESGTTGSTQFTAAYQGVTSTTGTVQVTPATLMSLTITIATGTLAKGTTEQLTATGTFSDGSVQDLTNQVNWSSTNGAALAINATGLTSAIGLGTAQITATSGSQTASTGTIQVTAATLSSVAVTPANGTIPNGTTQQYSLTGTFSDNSTQNLSGSASWTSSSTAVAGISSTGLATAMSTGTSTITGQSGSLSATATLTVSAATLTSVTVSPTSGSIALGTKQQFTATGHYSDGSTQNLSSSTNWISSQSNIISIDANGLATADGQTGSVTITPESPTGTIYTSFTFNVVPATLASIAVTPATASVTVSGTQQFTATGTYTDNSHQDLTTNVTWSSLTPSVANVNSSGLATGATLGNASIQAQTGTLTNSATLTVATTPSTPQSLLIMPSSASIANGTHQQFTAAVQNSDGSTTDVTAQTIWQSGTPAVATINSAGLATGVSGGSAQITGTYNSLTGSVVLTVSQATLTSLAVTPSTASIANGTTQQYTATGTLTDGSTQNLSNSVTWSASTPTTIGSTGLATSHGTGSSTIAAQSGTVSSNNATLTVTNATASSIQIQPASVSLAAGNTQQLMVTATFTDGSSQNVTQSSTYSTNNSAVATVSSSGLITSVAAGNATVTVTSGSTSTTVPVTVTSAVLQTIAITPANLSLAAGGGQQLTATGSYSDGSTTNLTNTVAWASSATSKLTVSSTGYATSLAPGTSNVTATLNSIVGSLPVTVTSAVVQSISVTPSSATLAAGQTQQYTAIATLSDGTQQTVTTSAHWSTSDSSRATISNTSGQNGLLTSVAGGTVTVTAAVGSVNGTATVIVTSATLSSLSITPAAFTVAQGTTEQLDVIGTYSDGSNQDLTTVATYTTSSQNTASVSSTGLVTATGTAGVAAIMATVGGMSATAAATAAPGVLVAIAVTPAATTIANGLTQQFTATGTYGGNQQNITSQVQWTSSNPAVATINSAGLAKSVGPGTTTIAATLSGQTGSTTLTVSSAVLQSLTVTSPQNSFALGQSTQMTATGNYSDGSTQNLTSSVTWTSLNPSVGVVSQVGVASGITAGVFGSQASLNGLTASTPLTVTNAVLQSITLTPANTTIINVLGNATQYTATGHFSDGTTQMLTTGVHWSINSSILHIGSISQSGVLSTTSVGTGNVVATYGSITGTTGFLVVSL